jgi:hypothetical protein
VSRRTTTARAGACKASGCTAKDGICVVGSDADCGRSELCKNMHKCAAKNSACTDASFNPALLNPALTNEQAPEKFKVKFSTDKGDFVVEVNRAWAPLGAERLYNLVKIGYYTDVAFYKVDGSTAEFGISGNPEVSSAWHESAIKADPPKQPNDRGYVAFAKARPNDRESARRSPEGEPRARPGRLRASRRGHPGMNVVDFKGQQQRPEAAKVWSAATRTSRLPSPARLREERVVAGTPLPIGGRPCRRHRAAAHGAWTAGSPSSGVR